MSVIIEQDPSDLLSSDDRHVAIRAALTMAEINMAAGEPTSHESLMEGVINIYNFLKLNKNEQD